MKKIFLFLILITAVYTLKAQNLITVQHGSDAAFYTNLDSAIIYAPSGSTIYIPGGSFALNTPINKLLYIYGVGHNPDSSSATNFTMISNDINFTKGASGGSITGLYIINNLVFGFSNNDSIKNYIVSKCNVNTIGNYDYCSNNLFSENIIRSQVVLRGTNNLFSNNIINDVHGFNNLIQIGSNNIFSNNIFLSDYNSIFGCSMQNCIFENNIFFSTNNNPSNCIFNNNLFACSWSMWGNCIGQNNFSSIQANTIFISQNGNTFSYTDDYHLQPTCLGKNAGKDGTDIGIYGGRFPWKDGSVPINPHIMINNVGGTTNSNGTLPVNIKVEAQNN